MPTFAGDTTKFGFSTFAQSLFSAQFIQPQPLYPTYGGIVQTSKVKTTTSGQGIIGTYIRNPGTNKFEAGLEFPANRNTYYFSQSGLWVGGIVDNDTLVSTSVCKEFYYSINNPFTLTHINNEFHAPFVNGDTATTILYKSENEELFHTVFNDTFIPEQQWWLPYFIEHKPMEIEVQFKTYTKNKPPFTNIVILDYIITNKNDIPINSAYIGLYTNSSVSGKCAIDTLDNYQDDLVGSFREEGLVYFIDNDGELSASNCTEERASGVMALKTMTTYPPVSDTNFNWWTNLSRDYAPQKKGTVEFPYRELSNAAYGTPQGDTNRYYVMSKPEWDFDQYATKSTIQNDSSWVTADDSILTAISQGSTPNSLLSLGPINLLPDSSIRTVFAIIGADLVHLNKNNFQNLLDENYETYYNNLYFGFLEDNIRFANILTNEYLSPLNKPYGFKATPLDSTTYQLNWDNYVLPEVLGYNVYIKEIPDEYLISHNIPIPNIDFETIPSELTLYTSETNNITISNLSPHKSYIAVVAHTTLSEEGALSDHIYLGCNNPFNKPAPAYPTQEFTPIHPDLEIATFKWYYPDNYDVAYFKIYKAEDSLSAIMRYQPFLYSQPDDIPFQPVKCFETDDSTICYFALEAYDSIPGNIQQYTDSIVVENNYYWVTAVNPYGIESDISHLIKAVKNIELDKDILAIIGATTDELDFAIEDSIVNYYDQLLDGYNYDLYYWTDSMLVSRECSTEVCLNWKDLARYKLILINEYPSPKLLTEKSESQSKLFTKLSDFGNNIAFFGIPTGDKDINIGSYANNITYNEFSFERNYMGLDQVNLKAWFGSYDVFDAVDSLGGFNKAVSNIQILPDLPIKSAPTFYKPFIKQLFTFDNYVPYIPTFVPTQKAEIMYTFQSAYPESSEQHGKAVGVIKQNKNNQIFTFGFHLWSMKLEPAKLLVRYLFNKQSTHYQSTTIQQEIILNQNYPNPFNAQTSFSFTLPQKSQVTIELFNVLGQKIKTILPTTQLPSGLHTYYWDGKNENGKTVSTGIYLYRLLTNESSQTKKMVFLK